MPLYAYRGRSAGGELVTGRLEAPDSGTAADQLASTGVTPSAANKRTSATKSSPSR